MLKNVLPVIYYCPKFWTLLLHNCMPITQVQLFLLQLSSNETQTNIRQGASKLMLVSTATLLVLFSLMNVKNIV